MASKCLLIGVDGAQFEKIQALKLNNFGSLYAYKGYTGGITSHWSEAQTLSGPGWATVLSGVWANRHGVRSNSSGAISPDVPTIFSLIKRAKPECRTASIITWAPIHSRFLVNEIGYIDHAVELVSDQSATDAGIECIKKGTYDFIFIQLSDVDNIGHAHGFGDLYDNALRAMDVQLGKLLDTVRSCDDWLVLVTTDHGRSDRNHGGQTLREKTVFVASNKVLNAEATNPVPIEYLHNKDYDGLYGHLSQASVTPTILCFLGVELFAKWQPDGPSLWGDMGVRKLMFQTLFPPKLFWYGTEQQGSIKISVNGIERVSLPVINGTWEDDQVEPGDSTYDYTIEFNNSLVALRLGNLHEVRATLDWDVENVFIFFQQRQLYSKFNWREDSASTGYPKPVSEHTWPGLGEYSSRIIAAFSKDANTAYFFLDDATYLRYSKATDRLENGPLPIDDRSWPGMGAYKTQVCAATRWIGPYAFFFLNNGTYLRFNLDNDRVDSGYPKSIDDKTWPGLEPYCMQIKSVVLASEKKAFIFLKGGRYLRYDVEADRVDFPNPRLIDDSTWPRLLG